MLTIKYFSTTTCGPCKMFGPLFDQIMSETKIQHQKIDAQIESNMSAQYSITSVPTLIFEKDNSIVHRHTGIMSRVQLMGIINKFK